MTASVPIIPTAEATLMLASANLVSLLRSRYQQPIPMTNIAPVIHPLRTEWKNLVTATGFVATAQKSTISLRTVSGLNSIPTGCCIQPFATRIQKADIAAPIPVIHVEARWKRRPTLSHPKNMTATNVASIKNANMPSMARGAPKMSPTNHE